MGPGVLWTRPPGTRSHLQFHSPLVSRTKLAPDDWLSTDRRTPWDVGYYTSCPVQTPSLIRYTQSPLQLFSHLPPRNMKIGWTRGTVWQLGIPRLKLFKTRDKMLKTYFHFEVYVSQINHLGFLAIIFKTTFYFVL